MAISYRNLFCSTDVDHFILGNLPNLRLGGIKKKTLQNKLQDKLPKISRMHGMKNFKNSSQPQGLLVSTEEK